MHKQQQQQQQQQERLSSGSLAAAYCIGLLPPPPTQLQLLHLITPMFYSNSICNAWQTLFGTGGNLERQNPSCFSKAQSCHWKTNWFEHFGLIYDSCPMKGAWFVFMKCEEESSQHWESVTQKVWRRRFPPEKFFFKCFDRELLYFWYSQPISSSIPHSIPSVGSSMMLHTSKRTFLYYKSQCHCWKL